MDTQIRLVIVDDHPMFRSGITLILEEENFSVVGQGSSASEVEQLVRKFSPDLILLDIDMPGDSFGAATKISGLYPNTRIVFLTVSESEDNIIKALRTGACAYVLKGVSGRELIRILRTIYAGESYVPPSFSDLLVGSGQCRCC